MEFIKYNSVEMEIVHFLEFQQTPVYSEDGADYLFTHFRIGVRAVWNPEATGGTMAETNNYVAAKALENLRHRLMQPRCALLVQVPISGSCHSTSGVTDEGNVLLRSPLKDPSGVAYSCDCNNGPKVLGVHINSIVGEKSAIVDFWVETWINECPVLKPLLSNRWTMTSDVDEFAYTTRTTSGISVFRTDGMTKEGLYPDDFRANLFPPVPWGFRRERVRVEATSDGTHLRWLTIDVEQPHMVKANGIVKFDGMIRARKGVGTANLSNVMNGARSGGSTFGRAGAFVGAAVGMLQTAYSAYPPLTYSLNLRAWGNRFTTRASLVNFLVRAAATFKMGPGDDAIVTAIAFYFIDIDIAVSVGSKYAELNANLRMPSEVAGFIYGTPVGGLAADKLPPQIHQIPENVGTLVVVDSATSQRLPADSGTRGYYLASMVAQRLRSSECLDPKKLDDGSLDGPSVSNDTGQMNATQDFGDS